MAHFYHSLEKTASLKKSFLATALVKLKESFPLPDLNGANFKLNNREIYLISKWVISNQRMGFSWTAFNQQNGLSLKSRGQKARN